MIRQTFYNFNNPTAEYKCEIYNEFLNIQTASKNSLSGTKDYQTLISDSKYVPFKTLLELVSCLDRNWQCRYGHVYTGCDHLNDFDEFSTEWDNAWNNLAESDRQKIITVVDEKNTKQPNVGYTISNVLLAGTIFDFVASYLTSTAYPELGQEMRDLTEAVSNRKVEALVEFQSDTNPDILFLQESPKTNELNRVFPEGKFLNFVKESKVENNAIVFNKNFLSKTKQLTEITEKYHYSDEAISTYQKVLTAFSNYFDQTDQIDKPILMITTELIKQCVIVVSEFTNDDVGIFISAHFASKNRKKAGSVKNHEDQNIALKNMLETVRNFVNGSDTNMFDNNVCVIFGIDANHHMTENYIENVMTIAPKVTVYKARTAMQPQPTKANEIKQEGIDIVGSTNNIKYSVEDVKVITFKTENDSPMKLTPNKNHPFDHLAITFNVKCNC